MLELCIPVGVCEDIYMLVRMSRDDSDDDLFFGRSRAEELSAVTVRELGRSSSSSSLGCLSSRAAELQSCRAAELRSSRAAEQQSSARAAAETN